MTGENVLCSVLPRVTQTKEITWCSPMFWLVDHCSFKTIATPLLLTIVRLETIATRLCLQYTTGLLTKTSQPHHWWAGVTLATGPYYVNLHRYNYLPIFSIHSAKSVLCLSASYIYMYYLDWIGVTKICNTDHVTLTNILKSNVNHFICNTDPVTLTNILFLAF